MMPWRRRLGLGISLGLVLVVAGLTPTLWGELDQWVTVQRSALWAQVEGMVGQTVVYDRIGPTVLSALDFQNVRILASDGTPILMGASIRFSVDWGLVFQGKFADALRRIQLINATLNLDARRDRDLIARWTGYLQAGSTVAYEVDGFNLKGAWTDGTHTVSLDRGFFVLTPHQDQWGLRFRGALTWQSPGEALPWATANLRGDLHSDLAFAHWNLRTEVARVRTAAFDLEPISVQVSASPDQITVAKVADQIPLDLQAIWSRQDGTWTFQGRSERFRPSALVHLKAQNAWRGLADGTVTGTFSYRWGSDFSLDGRGDWPAGSWPAPFDTAPVTALGSVRTEGGVYRFQGFHVEAPLLALGFDGTFDEKGNFPEGVFRLERFSLPGVGDAEGTWVLTRQGFRTGFETQGVRWNGITTDRTQGYIEKTASGWNFQIAGPLPQTQGGSVSITGSANLSSSEFEAQISAVGVPGSLVTAEAQKHWAIGTFPEALQNLSLTVQARVTASPTAFAIPSATFDLQDPHGAPHRIKGTLQWQDQRLDLGIQTLQWDSVQASAQTVAEFRRDGTVEGRLTGQVLDRPVDLAGRWTPSDHTLVVSGSPGIQATLHQEADRWLASFTVDPWEFTPGWTVGFQGRADLGTPWSATADTLTLTGRYPWNHEAFQATGRVSVTPDTLRWDKLTVTDPRGSLVGQAASSWFADGTTPWKGQLSLATPGTQREAVELTWEGATVQTWQGTARLSGLDLARFPRTPVQGRLSLVGTVESHNSAVTWSAQTTLTDARWGDSPLGWRGEVSGTDRRLEVRKGALSVGTFRATEGTLDLDLDARTWNAGANVGFRFGSGAWSSHWLGEGKWTPEGRPFRGDYTLRTENNTWSQKPFPNGGLSGHWGDDGWSAALADGTAEARGDPQGTFHFHAQAPFPVRADADGTWTQTKLAVRVHGFQTSIGLIKDFVSTPQFGLKQGDATGDFTVGGSPVDPEVTGTLMVRGLTMTSSFVRQTVGPVDVPVTFDGHQIRVAPINVGPRGQSWLVSGVVRLDHLIPEEFEFSLDTGLTSSLPVSYPYNGISAAGSVTGTLVVRGTPLAITVGGRLLLEETSITLKKSPDEGKGLGFNVDLTLITGKKVEFLWPNETLPLIRAVTAPNQVLVIKANDVASTWSVIGKLGLKTGEVNYLGHTFVLKEGWLGFQESQLGFDPQVSVRASYVIQANTGLVTINLKAHGPLSQFSPQFDSVPYLSPDELQQLVGPGLTASSDYGTTSDAALSLASDVGTSFLLAPFEETVRKNFHLDQFTVQTQVLKRSLLNRNGALAAADYLDNTRLFFGKYIGDDFFLQGTLAFSQGTLIYNEDGTVTTEGAATLVVEPELLMEFQTPLFLLDWDLLPRHPETLYVTDNTVTFRWNWSY